MTKDKAIEVIIAVLKEIAEVLCEEDDVKIDVDTRPIADLGGFDSLAGVSATVDCLVYFKMENDMTSLFVEKNNALTIGAAADRLVALSNKRKKGRK
jgi:acyl carrier protein